MGISKLVAIIYNYIIKIMSNISSFSLINSKVQKIKTEEGLTSPGVAFMKLGLATILKLNEEEIEESLTDGPDDGEIDAIYIDNNVIHMFTFKYTDQFELSKKNYPGSELEQFALHVDMFIGGNLTKKTINNAVWEKYEEVKALTNKKVEFKIYVVSNKLEPTGSSRTKFEEIIEKFKGVEKPIYIDQDKLVEILLLEKTIKIDGSFHFIDKQYFEKSDGNIKTVIGVITASELIELIKSESDDKLTDENIFNENVRVYKPKHRINKEIIESAKSKTNFEFFYLNNGITILCEEIDYIPNTRSPLVELKNLQIINGGQTSHSLFEVNKTDPDKLQNIELLVRICVAKKDDPISGKISETTNSQIPVATRDLRSNDFIQRKLKADFETLGYFYETKPNEYLDKPKNKVLNNEVLGQLYLSYQLDMPSEAKNKKTIVFGENYEDIFDENIITSSELLRLYNLYLPILKIKVEIQTEKRKKIPIAPEREFISWATLHIIFGIKLLYQKEINKINSETITEKDKKIKIGKLLVNNPQKYIDQSIKEIANVVEKEKQKSVHTFSFDKFFKEISSHTAIKNHFENLQ